MAGSTGALNLLVCLHVMRQLDFQTQTTPVCLSSGLFGEAAPSDVSLALSSFSKPVFPSRDVSPLLISRVQLLMGSLRQILTLTRVLCPSELVKMGWRAEPSDCESCLFVLVPSLGHPLRTSRAAMRKESAWLCSISEQYDSGGPGMADLVSRSEGAGLLLPTILLLLQVATSVAVIQKV